MTALRIALALLSVWFFFQAPALRAQTLEGQWEGTMTLGGINSARTVPFSLYIYRNGERIWGRSYLHLGPGQIIAMDLKGWLYHDRSIGLQESRFAGDPADGLTPPYFRKYQLLFKRGIYDGSLNGYWQEVRDEALHDTREGGRIYLKKKEPDKA